MRIQKIRIEKFKSVYDTTTLDFNYIRGLWKICGPVGAGKTTIGEAIIFGLFGSVAGKNNQDLISWGEKHGVVEVWLTSKGHNIYIKRELNKYGQSPIYVDVDGEELMYTNKRDGQNQLESEYYDVSRTTLELLCIISFNNFKSLATLNANDTKRFLDQVLGFFTLTQYSETCKDFRKQVIMEGQNIGLKIDNNQAQVNKILELACIARIEGDMQAVRDNISAMEATRDGALRKIDDMLTDMRKRWTMEQQQITKIKTLGANKKKEIDFIKKGVCPTCGASIDQSQLDIKEREREVFVEQYKAAVNLADSIQNDIIETESKRRDEETSWRNKLQGDRELLTQLGEQEKRSKINMAEIGKLNNENQSLQQQMDGIQAEISEWDELYTILSESVRAKILSSFIPALNKNILRYTQQLQLSYIINFDSSFKCSINICGMDEEIPLSALSTGQLKSVDLCIILGVLGTIMNNISFNITFLDELISNMDSDLRSIMCQTMKQNQKSDQTLFIISHTDLDSKYFEGEISTHLEFIDEVHKKSIYSVEKNQSYDKNAKYFS